MNSRQIARSTARLKRRLCSRSNITIARHLTALPSTLRRSSPALSLSPNRHLPSTWHRFFSTSNNDKTFGSSMRNMIKPFFMKAHPDVQTSEKSKEINLEAIQNLNAFLDQVELRFSNPTAKIMKNEKRIFKVDFCVMMEERVRGKKEEILCRRKVDLAIPEELVTPGAIRMTIETRIQYQRQVENQLVKLLHIAGLKAPEKAAFEETTDIEDKVRRDWDQAVKTGDFSKLNQEEIEQARKQKLRRNRTAFAASVDWKKFDQVFKETVKDLEASSITDGLIRDNPQQRMAYLAEILSRVRVGEDKAEDAEEGDGQVDPISQLIALRRLAILLDDHFDDLCLEELGNMWDSTTIVLTAPRDYNTSPSALYRRRKRKTKGDVMANDGYSFALTHENAVTIHIPVDFRDDELLSQLKRHVKDYHSLISLGLDDIFPRFPKEEM